MLVMLYHKNAVTENPHKPYQAFQVQRDQGHQTATQNMPYHFNTCQNRLKNFKRLGSKQTAFEKYQITFVF